MKEAAEMASSAVSKLIEEHREFVGRGARVEHSWLALTIVHHMRLQNNMDTIRSVHLRHTHCCLEESALHYSLCLLA